MQRIDQLDPPQLWLCDSRRENDAERFWCARMQCCVGRLQVADIGRGVRSHDAWRESRTVAANIHRALIEVLPERRNELETQFQAELQAIDRAAQPGNRSSIRLTSRQ